MSFQRAKTVSGERIKNVNELLRRMDAGQWFYLNRRPVNPKIIANMSLSYLRAQIRNGTLCVAVERYSKTYRPYVSKAKELA